MGQTLKVIKVKLTRTLQPALSHYLSTYLPSVLHYCCQPPRHRQPTYLLTPHSSCNSSHNRKVPILLLTLRKKKIHLYGRIGKSNCILYEGGKAVNDWLKYTAVVGQLDYRFFGIRGTRIHRLYIPYLPLLTLPYLTTQGTCAAAQTMPRIHIMHFITPISFLPTSVLGSFPSFSVSLYHVLSPWVLAALPAIWLRVKSCSLSDGIQAPPTGNKNAGKAQWTVEDRISFHSSFLSAH